MKSLQEKAKLLGVNIPEAVIPSPSMDLHKWSVVACDQYTSQPEYWNNVESLVGESPSTLRMIYPEVFLEEEKGESRIHEINRTMNSYLSQGIIEKCKPGFIFVDRSTSHVKSRKGLMLAVDLEKYDYNKGSQTLIRATEGTVLERIPPRVKIRQNASLELPHIMVLIDDPARSVIEPVACKVTDTDKLYDFELMMDGGHITGWKAGSEAIIRQVLEALEELARPETFRARYGVGPDKGVLLFAVGDGNHSLASAKAHWENIKKSLPVKKLEDHPSRFALVELVNVHDEGIVFEPIHRVVFNINAGTLLDSFVKYYSEGSAASYKIFDTKDEMEKEIKRKHPGKGVHILPFITNSKYGYITVSNPKFNLEVGTLQAFIDQLLLEDKNIRVDYIHGEEVVTALGSKENNMGFYLPVMDKHDLFKTVILDGVLPRKTFSMGEAEEKRFYLECRKIVI